ncbi:hypothetical protein [Hoeflea sp. TYP-13]
MVMFALGERLGKTLSEIGAMPYAELIGWLAYFQLKKETRS